MGLYVIIRVLPAGASDLDVSEASLEREGLLRALIGLISSVHSERL